MLEQLIYDIFKEKPINIQRLEEGITNQDFLVTLKDKKVVVRIPYPNNHEIINYEIEEKCLDLIAPYNLDVPLLYFDKRSGIKITLFVEDLKTFNHLHSVEQVIEVAHLLRHFHSLPIILNHPFNLREMYQTFKDKCISPRYSFDCETELLNQLDRYQKISTVCHNDLVGGNLCFTKERSYLIDFEYAKDNDPYFDLASFITENDIQDQTRRHAFVENYFIEETFDQEKFYYYEQLLYLFWCQWSMMNEEISDDPIFKEISDLKAKRLTELIKKHQTL